MRTICKELRARNLTLLLTFVFFMVGATHSAEAKTYITVKGGNWTDKEIWQPSYPGILLKEKDSVVIYNKVTVDAYLVVRGNIHMSRGSIVLGGADMVISRKGRLVNEGIYMGTGVVSRGTIVNRGQFEVLHNIQNSGFIANNGSLIAGKNLNNFGTITGNSAKYSAKEKILNGKNGLITGELDICSEQFTNHHHAQLDSAGVSFCGLRIFRRLYLNASHHSNGVALKIFNAAQADFASLEILKSTDGNNFASISKFTKAQLKANQTDFSYIDDNRDGTTAAYKLQINYQDELIAHLPTVSVIQEPKRGKRSRRK